jgi:hypothetical protein
MNARNALRLVLEEQLRAAVGGKPVLPTTRHAST